MSDSRINYDASDIPDWYWCRECAVKGVKLFRLAFARKAPPMCASCAQDDLHEAYTEADAAEMKWHGDRCAAIPLYTDDSVMAGVYAFTDAQRAWWLRLPLRKEDP